MKTSELRIKLVCPDGSLGLDMSQINDALRQHIVCSSPGFRAKKYDCGSGRFIVIQRVKPDKLLRAPCHECRRLFNLPANATPLRNYYCGECKKKRSYSPAVVDAQRALIWRKREAFRLWLAGQSFQAIANTLELKARREPGASTISTPVARVRRWIGALRRGRRREKAL